MRISNTTTDDAALGELGSRLARRRLDLQLSQAQLALDAGVSKRTIERLEAGSSSQLASFLRVLRVLGLLDAFDSLIPADGPSPIEVLRSRGRARQRARGAKPQTPPSKPWTWGDET